MSGNLLTDVQRALDDSPSSTSHQLTPPTSLTPQSSQTSLFDRDPYAYNYGYGYDYSSPSYKPKQYGPRNYSKTPTTYSSTTYRAVVIHANGEEDAFTIPYDCDGWYNIAKYVWPTADNRVRIPVEHCTFEYKDPTFNACVYTATNDYMQARWGRKLDDSDRRWLAAHPLSTDNGVPQEYTATCVDQLVTPYGMRVSRIRLRKGSLVLGDSVMQWIQALGCNPFAMVDRSTSNAEAAEKMGITLEQANALWRVEFSDDPLPASVVGERGWTSGNGVSTGSFGGHARYLAPRAKAGDWFISLQLEPDTNVSYLVPPPNPDYVPRRGDATLLLAAVTGPDKELIADRVNGKWQPISALAAQRFAEGAAAPAETKSEAPTPTEASEESVDPSDRPVATTLAVPRQRDSKLIDGSRDTETCLVCNNNRQLPEMMVEADVCHECLQDAWSGYDCPHCRVSFQTSQPPRPLAHESYMNGDEFEWECPTCKGVITVYEKDNDDALISMLCEAVFYNVNSWDYDELDRDLPPASWRDLADPLD